MEQENQNLFDLRVDAQGLNYLSEAARWARFIAIIGFIFCGLMVVAAFFIGTIMSVMMSQAFGTYSSVGGGVVTFFYLIFAVIWFIPCLFLFRFGAQMRTAATSNQQDKLNVSLGNLKSYFKYIAILFIIMLVLYGIGIVGALIAGVVMR